MSLSTATVNKFVRESFVLGTAMKLDASELPTFKQRITKVFQQADGLKFTWHTQGTRQGDTELFTFGLEDPRYQGSWSSSFRVVCDARSELHLRPSYSHDSLARIGSEAELLAFIHACQQRAARHRGQHAKSSKVRNLRKSAIRAWVQQQALAQQCDYAIREGNQSVAVLFRINESKVIEFSVPYARFQEMLPVLEAVLPALHNIADAGISASIRSGGQYAPRYCKWMSYKALAVPSDAPAEEEG